MMLRWPPLGLCTTEATEEGVCSTQPKRAGPLENGRHWFDDAVAEAGIRVFAGMTFPIRSRAGCESRARQDIAELLEHKSLTMTRRYAHLGPNKLHAGGMVARGK